MRRASLAACFICLAGCAQRSAPPSSLQPVGDSAPAAVSIPSFEWPPPKASASVGVPTSMLTGNRANLHLGDVANALEKAFNSAGYVESSYYAVPQGFALASRLEKINPNGSPVAEASRWSANIDPPKVFSLSSYLQALLGATPGNYRVVVFIVTAAPVTETGGGPSLQQAQDWLTGGANKLPPAIAGIPLTSDTACTALIYEFVQQSRDASGLLKLPSALTGLAHLEAAGLWKALNQ